MILIFRVEQWNWYCLLLTGYAFLTDEFFYVSGAETRQGVLHNMVFILINLFNQGFIFIDILFAFYNTTLSVFQKY